jgi:hypothetical protein
MRERRFALFVVTGIIMDVLLAVVPGWATTTIILDFQSLPSAQGWTYMSSGPLEANAFSVDGSKLIQNTMGTGSTFADYHIASIVNPTLPFTIAVRVRVLQSEQTQPGAPATAVTIGAFTGTEVFGFGLNTGNINVAGTTMLFPFDTTQFHDYRIEAVPGVKMDLFVDNVLLTSIPPVLNNAPNDLLFGNGSSFENGSAEITNFTFIQGVPAVGGLITGAYPQKGTVTCRNLTTRKTVRIPLKPATAWDCEAAGLAVNPGDKMRIQLQETGTAN